MDIFEPLSEQETVDAVVASTGPQALEEFEADKVEGQFRRGIIPVALPLFVMLPVMLRTGVEVAPFGAGRFSIVGFLPANDSRMRTLSRSSLQARTDGLRRSGVVASGRRALPRDVSRGRL